MLLAERRAGRASRRPRDPTCSGRRSAAWASPGSSSPPRSGLIPIETSRLAVDTDRLPNLDALLAGWRRATSGYRYSVAWIDPIARGRHLGRGVLTRGRPRTARLGRRRSTPSTRSPTTRASASPSRRSSPGPASSTTPRSRRSTSCGTARRRAVGSARSCRSPASSTPSTWSGRGTGCTGARGFVQYQFAAAVRRRRARCDRRSSASQRRVRRASSPCSSASGQPDPAPLSFPAPGWTLTVDVPAPTSDLGALLHGLDELVLDAGGRHYLTKDSHMTPADRARRATRASPSGRPTRRSVDPDGHLGQRPGPPPAAARRLIPEDHHGQRPRRTTDDRAPRRHERHRPGDRRAPRLAGDAHHHAGRAATQRRLAPPSSSGRG